MSKITLDTLVIYVTFSRRNIFVNWYKITKYGRFSPYIFFTLRCLGYDEKKISEKSIELFIQCLKSLLVESALVVGKTILVFRNFGQKLIRHEGFRSNWSISWMREALFDALLKEDIFISAVVDRSPIPFNGCRTKKLRRKKYKRNRLVKEGYQL